MWDVQGEVGMCTRSVQTARPCLGSFIEMAMSGLSCRNAWVGFGRAISIVLGTNEFRNKPSHLVGPPFQET